MAYKQKGFPMVEGTALHKKSKDPKLSKKVIVRAADIELKKGGTFPTEQAEDSDYDKIGVNVYKKGGKKYVKDYETGEFKQIKTKKLKKEGQLIGKRKQKKVEGLSGDKLSEALKPKKQKR